MSNIIGIDLGTTMSAIATLNSLGKPEIIPSSEGDRITPSVIFFGENNHKATIGSDAKNSAEGAPERVSKEFKRQMHDLDYRFKVDKIEYTASQLSSLILKKLAQDASKNIGNIEDVVISVPAYFKEKERNATMEAGQLAGLNVIGIINEPTAAALYYASTDNVNGKVLIYDLGGGTFDVTLVDIKGKDITIVASQGDHHLGGVDFDLAVLEIFESKYKAQKSTNLYNTRGGKEGFLLRAEVVKKALSRRTQVKESLKGDGGELTIEITQEEFEEKISSYISRTELLVEQVLHEADIEAKDVSHILLVGGSTRIPAFSKSIKSIMGKEPISKVNVDEAVALGAAIKAGLITVANEPHKVSANIAREINSVKLTDVANHSYGTIISTYDRVLDKHILANSIIIGKNTQLPCSFTKTFYTVSDGQEAVDISITQGEDADPDFVDKIHEENMDLPPNRPSGQPIEVTYQYDENQIMHCIFKDVNSGRSKPIQLNMQNSKKKSLDLNSFLVE